MPAITNGRAGLLLKLGVVVLVAAASNIWIADVSNTLSGRSGSPSIWIGVGALALLLLFAVDIPALASGLRSADSVWEVG